MAKNKPAKSNNPLAALNQPGQKAGQGKAKSASPAPKPVTPPAPRPVKKTRPAAVSQRVTVLPATAAQPATQTSKRTRVAKPPVISKPPTRPLVQPQKGGLGWLWILLAVLVIGAVTVMAYLAYRSWSGSNVEEAMGRGATGSVVAGHLPKAGATDIGDVAHSSTPIRRTNGVDLRIPGNGGNAIGSVTASNNVYIAGHDLVVPNGTIIGSLEKPKWPAGYTPTVPVCLDRYLPDELAIGQKVEFGLDLDAGKDVPYYWRDGWTVQLTVHCPLEWYDYALGNRNVNDSRGEPPQKEFPRVRNRYGVPVKIQAVAWKTP